MNSYYSSSRMTNQKYRKNNNSRNIKYNSINYDVNLISVTIKKIMENIIKNKKNITFQFSSSIEKEYNIHPFLYYTFLNETNSKYYKNTIQSTLYRYQKKLDNQIYEKWHNDLSHKGPIYFKENDFSLMRFIPKGNHGYIFIHKDFGNNMVYLSKKFVSELIRKNNYYDIKKYIFVIPLSNDNQLLKLGSSTMGTIFYVNQINERTKGLIYFVIEDIIYYQSYHMHNVNIGKRINIINSYLFDINKSIINKKNIFINTKLLEKENVFTVYQNNKSYDNLIIENNKYYNQVYSIQYSDPKKNYWITIINNDFNKIVDIYSIYETMRTREDYFYIHAELNEDCYSIYKKKNSKMNITNENVNDELLHKEYICKGKLLVNKLRDSIILNNEFRCIKENENLDLLEMSDDEDEFEMNNIYDKTKNNILIKHKCRFNNKYRLWELSN